MVYVLVEIHRVLKELILDDEGLFFVCVFFLLWWWMCRVRVSVTGRKSCCLWSGDLVTARSCLFFLARYLGCDNKELSSFCCLGVVGCAVCEEDQS